MAIACSVTKAAKRSESRISVANKKKTRLRLLPLIVTCALLTPGCTKQSPSDEEKDPTPTISPTLSARYTGKWKALSSKCPTLTGGSAKKLGLIAGADPDLYLDNVSGTITQCTWRKETYSIVIDINLFRLDDEQRNAEQKARQKIQDDWNDIIDRKFAIRYQDDLDFENESHIGIHRDQSRVILMVRSSNVVIGIMHKTSEGQVVDSDESLMAYRETMRGLAEDVLDDLR